MSQLQTIKSNSRPTSPVEGSVFYETDTKRILVYAQGAYHIYNRDTLSSSTGGGEELNYLNGLYSNSEATYFLNTSPEVHLDTAHWDGVNRNGADIPNLPAGQSGDWRTIWWDRTNNRHPFFRSNATHNANRIEDRNGFDTFWGIQPTNHNYYRNDLNYYWSQDGQLIPTNTLSGLFDDFTVFAVIGVHVENIHFTWTGGNHSLINATNIVLGSGGSARYLTDVYTTAAGPLTGPRLVIIRNSTNLAAWGAEEGGVTTPVTTTAAVLNYTTALGLVNSFDVTYELMFFKSALNIAEINTVKDYLQNKYSGAGAPHFPVGGTAPLTES